VSLTEAKAHTRVDHTSDDTYLSHLIVAAQDMVEAYTGRKFMEGTYVLILDDFPKDGIYVPYVPVKSVSSVKYYNSTNADTTLATGDYYYNIYEEPFRIHYKDGEYPDVYDYRSDNVRVTFKSGYTTPDAVPPALKHAILVLVGDMYENRLDQPREKFSTWKMLAHPFRAYSYV